MDKRIGWLGMSQKEDSQIANKQVEACSASLFTNEM